MTDKELKKLSRKDLLYMLVSQGKELQELREKYAKAEAALEDRSIQLEKAGSIAEASLQMNGIFEAAEAACQQYVENVARLSRKQDEICAQREAQSRKQAQEILEEAQEQREAMIREAKAQCAEMLKQAEKESKERQDEVLRKLSVFLDTHQDLKNAFLKRMDKKV